jgi:hypothetical protein
MPLAETSPAKAGTLWFAPAPRFQRAGGAGRPYLAPIVEPASEGDEHDEAPWLAWSRGASVMLILRLPSDPRRSKDGRRAYSASMNGYSNDRAGAKVSLMARGLIQRTRFRMEPALSFVPLARAPPKGCWPTTAPVGLSFT